MTLLWASFFWGCAFGAAARLGRFCLLRGLRQSLGQDNSTPRGSAPALQAFALALAIAVLASQGLHWAGLVDLGNAQIVRTSFSIPGVLIGGALFGIGMVLANSCGARALVLLAGGNLRALVTVVFLGLAAQASLTGVLVPVRQWFQALAPTTVENATLPQVLQAAQWTPLASFALLALLPALLLTAYALWQPALRRSPAQWISAIAIGALVAFGWWLTATVDVDPFDPEKLTSLSFIAPIAEGLLYLQVAVGRAFSLGPSMVLGVLAGGLVMALLTRTAQWEGFHSPAHLAKTAVGGALMGFGGVLAVGCSIGQGLTGLSTLAIASLPAVAGIVGGTLIAVKLFPSSSQAAA
ncbi:YeeE/YedE family protein [Comamonas sp.]|uniref:YeeE/YedE family protein n=1 Tax=Comamonas sp. TaxID=34028 RepID=UPI002FC9258B